MLWFKMCSTDNNEILYTSRHLHYCDVSKYICDRPNMLWSRALQNFAEYRIRSKYRSWDRRLDCEKTSIEDA